MSTKPTMTVYLRSPIYMTLDGSRLKELLMYWDKWKPHQAMLILGGFQPMERGGSMIELKEILDDGIESNARWSLNQLLSQVLDVNELFHMRWKVEDLCTLWLSGHTDDELHPPAFYIEWALSKQFRPAWLDWAIEKNLYTERLQTAPATEPTPDTDKETSEVEPEAAWKKLSKIKASEIYKREKKTGCDPSTEDIAKAIEKEFASEGVLTVKDKRINADYILRHGLEGWERPKT